MRVRSGLFVIMFALMLAGVPEAHSATKRPIVGIGTVADGPSAQLNAINNQIQREILELTRGEYDVRFPTKRQLNASWSLQGIKGTLDNLLADPNVDLGDRGRCDCLS